MNQIASLKTKITIGFLSQLDHMEPRTKPDFRVYLIPAVIAFIHGLLSVFGLSQGLEYYFWFAAIIIGAVLLGIGKQKNIVVSSLLIGLLIAAATGIPQTVFIEIYFENNPEYLTLGETLPMSPRMFILLLTPVVGVGIGLVVLTMGWIIAQIKSKI